MSYLSGNDHENTKAGGLAEKVLGSSMIDIVEFPDMIHGWTVRGNVKADPNVDRDTKKAMDLLLKCLQEEMK